MGVPWGQGCSYIALVLGTVFFGYALKYYGSTILALCMMTKPALRGPERRGREGTLAFKEGSETYSNHFIYGASQEEPFVSIHLPLYNEVNVAGRVIQACMDINYGNCEVLVVDDSRDETVEILKDIRWRKSSPVVKFVHRRDRSGFKGGALANALEYMDPRTKYVVVFDADFIPPPDILNRFIECFKEEEGLELGSETGRMPARQLRNRKPVAAVQGYQLHHLNKSENWLTRGVRAEYSGSYMVERPVQEFFGAMKMISGSVFMLRADVARRLGWSTSITEDWELTLKLYLEGYRVLYTPLIQAPAEIPNTVKRLAKQRMRWAEGHTHAVREYFWNVLGSPRLTIREKLEFVYFSPYYLQSLFFLVGTICWVIAEFTSSRPRFWGTAFGWSLVLSNFLALPLMGLAALFLEGDLHEDYPGVFSFIAVSYILTPFQAYAALKGLLEREEGAWIRTLKTGSITDRVLSVKFRGLFAWLASRGILRGDPSHDKDKTVVKNFPLSPPVFRTVMTAAIVVLMLTPFATALITVRAHLDTTIEAGRTPGPEAPVVAELCTPTITSEYGPIDGDLYPLVVDDNSLTASSGGIY